MTCPACPRGRPPSRAWAPNPGGSEARLRVGRASFITLVAAVGSVLLGEEWRCRTRAALEKPEARLVDELPVRVQSRKVRRASSVDPRLVRYSGESLVVVSLLRMCWRMLAMMMHSSSG